MVELEEMQPVEVPSAAEIEFDTSELERMDVSEFDDIEEESEIATEDETSAAAEVTAAITAGTVATAIEFFLKPVKVDDETRETFAEKLAPVFAKHDGAMPPWLARLIADWEEERKLAVFLVAAGWEISKQYKAANAEPVDELPPTEKPRVRVKAA